MSFDAFLLQCQQRIHHALDCYLPAANLAPAKLHRAMRYAVLNNGKRLRPLLVYATGELLQTTPEILDALACAVELIHCYSLVHDDLPALDNDDLRRGQPTCHKAFDEATAILVGDALQNLAFETLATFSNADLPAPQQLKIIAALTVACNSTGMVGGQALDLAATGKTISLAELIEMHRRKTGALIHACVQMTLLTNTSLNDHTQQHLNEFAQHIGLAYQIQDDILDVEGNTEILGKRAGADAALHKATYPALIGMVSAKQKLLDCYEQAICSLSSFDARADYLRALAEYIVKRVK